MLAFPSRHARPWIILGFAIVLAWGSMELAIRINSKEDAKIAQKLVTSLSPTLTYGSPDSLLSHFALLPQDTSQLNERIRSWHVLGPLLSAT